MFRKRTIAILNCVSETAASAGLQYALFTFVDKMGVVSHRVAYFESHMELSIWVSFVKPKVFDVFEVACLYENGRLEDLKGI